MRERKVNRRGEIKLFGRTVYLGRDLAAARVLVRLDNDLATVYHGPTVLHKRIVIPDLAPRRDNPAARLPARPTSHFAPTNEAKA